MMLILSFLLIGLGYISVIPIFEGFDETAHFSRIIEVSENPKSIFFKTMYIDQKIDQYKGPQPFLSGHYPYQRTRTYDNFFRHNELVDEYRKSLNSTSFLEPFKPSETLNWQVQHPPLYYVLMSLPYKLAKHYSLSTQIFIIRFTSLVISLLGVLFAILGFLKYGNSKNYSIKQVEIGFLLYPLMFPMFFVEFARVGNDSLCVFLVGLLTYLLLQWQQTGYPRKTSFCIGITIALGLLTKIFFLPILIATLAYMIFLGGNGDKHLKVSIFLTSLPVLLSCIWYLVNFLKNGDLGVGFEAKQLGVKVDFLTGLVSNFDFIDFLRGSLVPIVTFFWAGTWSLVRLPIIFYMPLFGFFSWMVFEWFFVKKCSFLRGFSFYSFSVLGLMYLGLIWHVLVMMVLEGVPTSPGWYLHILMPILAPILGITFTDLLVKSKFEMILKVSLSYMFVFPFLAISLHMMLFSGYATKGVDKNFSLLVTDWGNSNLLVQIFNNLTLISHPYVGLLSLFSGFALLALVLIKSKKNLLSEFKKK